MKNSLLVGISTIAISTLVLISCSKDASTRPNFIFKAAPNQSAVVKISGKTISHEEIFKDIKTEIYDAELKVHELKLNAIKGRVLEILMEQDPKKKGMSNDDYLSKYIAGSISVDQKEIDAFIKDKNIPKNALNDNLKTRIKAHLEAEKKASAIEVWLAKQTAKNPIEIYLTAPKRPVFEIPMSNSPFAGGADAKVTVVEFSDFECPYCQKGAELLRKLKKKYGNKIKVVFKQYPLPFHPNAKKASMASLCGKEQKMDYFWKLHDIFFENQKALDEASLYKYAKTVKGLDQKKFKECFSSQKYLAQVDAEIKEGSNIGVKSTPTFFVNGMIISGARDISMFSELIDQELSK